jgi:hypothetical protein
VDKADRDAAERARSLLARGSHDPAELRRALLAVAPAARDAWLDAVLGLGEIPDDGPDLPRDGVPYLPCPVDALLRVVDEARVEAADVFVDVGGGVGRAAAFVHLVTGARAVAIEIQRGLASAARELSARFPAARLAVLEGDAGALVGGVPDGTVFFLYCPFSGARLARVLDEIEPLARARPLRVCCVDVPLPLRPWLRLDPPGRGGVAIHRTTFHE